MNKPINIYYNKHKNIIQEFDNIEINDIENIVNFSVSNIYCSCLNYFEKSMINAILMLLFKKLKPEGLIVISFTDLKESSKRYYENSISDEQLMENLLSHKSILSISAIKKMIEDDPSVKIVKIDYDHQNLKINLTLQRISI
jgi:predicted SAM-dependent methyltransferase